MKQYGYLFGRRSTMPSEICLSTVAPCSPSIINSGFRYGLLSGMHEPAFVH